MTTSTVPPAASSHSLMAPPPSLSSVAPVPSIYIVPGSPNASTDYGRDSPWCYFDASATPQPKFTTPLQTDRLDGTLYMLSRVRHSPPPTFSRHNTSEDLVLPKRVANNSPNESTCQEGSGRDWMRKAAEEAGADNDSEIVEVIKVRKCAIEPAVDNQRPRMKRSKSLKLRAVKALQSLKNVGKSAHPKSPPPVPPLPSSPPDSTPSVLSPPVTQIHSPPIDATVAPEPLPKSGRKMVSKTVSERATGLARRSSYALSSLFSPPKQTEGECMQSLSPPSSPKDPHSPPSSLPISKSENFARPLSPVESPDLDPELFARSASPTPSTRRKFSMLNLNRIFTPPSQSAPPASPPAVAPHPRSSSGTSEASSSSAPRPATPPDGVGLIPRLSEQQEEEDLPDSDTESFGPVHGRRFEPDLSFGELKLDSLHFDELSFDVSRF